MKKLSPNTYIHMVRSEERRVGKECRSRRSAYQAEDGIRDRNVTGVQTCALPIFIYAKEKTKNNNGLYLNFALNYGSRLEIMHAIKRIMHDIDCSKLSVDALDEKTFSEYLYTHG